MVPVMLPPTSPQAVLNNLIAEDILNPSAPLEPISPTIEAMAKVVQGISTDGDLTCVKTDMTRTATNRMEKSEIVTSFLAQIDHERLPDWCYVRAKMEKRIKRAADRGEINTNQAIVVYGLANEAIDGIQSRQPKTKPVDASTVVEKVDVKKVEAEASMEARWAGTTPQGREIIRKKLYRLKKTILAEMEASGTVTEITSEAAPAP
jgi:hypothetical protein